MKNWIKKVALVHLLSLVFVGLVAFYTEARADDVTEINTPVMIMSSLMYEGNIKHELIGIYSSTSECKAWCPFYRDLVGHFDNPGNIESAEIGCYLLKE